jgi:hypothetical protein
MTFYAKVGTFLMAGGTPADQAITGLGFTPKVLIFFGGGNANVNTWAGIWDSALGFATSSSVYGVTTMGDAAAGTTSNCSRDMAAKAFTVVYAGVAYDIFTLKTFDADGFTITWTTAASQQMGYLALGGTDITNATVKAWTAIAGTGTQTVSGVGFQPDLVMTIGDEMTAIGITTEAITQIGACEQELPEVINQWALDTYAKNGVTTTQTERVQITDAFAVGLGHGTSITRKASLTNMNSDGFVMNWGVAGGSHVYYSLCIKGGAYSVGKFNKPTGAAPQTINLSCNTITPAAIMLFSDAYIASASAVTGARLMMGADDGTNHSCYVAQSKNGVTPASTAASQAHFNDRSIDVANNDTKTDEAIGTVGSFGLGTATASFPSTNNAVATEICYIIFGGSNSPTVSMPCPSTVSASNVPTPQVTKPLTVVPGTSSASNKPTPQVGPTMSCPGTSSAALVPTPKVNVTSMPCPGGTADPVAVTPTVSPGILTCPGTTSATGAVLSKVTKIMPVPDATAAAGIVTALPSIAIYPAVVNAEAYALDPSLTIDALVATVVIGSETYVLDPSDIVVWDGSFSTDLTLDEATDIKIYGVARNPDGSPYNLATATLEWNMRDHTRAILAHKSTADGSIIIDSPELGMFHFSLSHTDTDFDLEPTIKKPVIARHEARVINGAEQFVGLRGRVFIMPSQTGGS